MSSFQSLFNESSLNINLIIAVDNISIDYNSTGQLEVKDGGISTAKIANLAVTNAKISDMDASKLTGTVTIPIDTTLVEADTILVSYGSLGTPSIAFKLEPTTGIYHSSVGEMTLTSQGTAVVKLNSLGFSVLTGQILAPDGSNTAPSFGLVSDPTTGIFRYSAATLGITSAGTTVARFNTSGVQTFVPITTNGNSLTCGNLTTSGTNTFSGLTANTALYLNSSKVLTSAALTDGQLLIGSTSGAPTAATLTGTTNQVNVTNGSNTITLSLPQNIHTGATPTFAGAFLNGTTVVGASSAVAAGVNKLQIVGTNSSTAGPHQQFFTTSDSFPLLQFLPYAHDNISLNFDSYWDGSWRSSSTSSNFQILKDGSTLSLNYFAGATLGSAITAITTNKALTVNTSGAVSLPVLSANSTLFLNSSKNITGSVLTNGQLLIGRTGNTVIAGTLTGTTNQINVTNGSGTITLATPQNIATTSDVTFNSVGATDHVYIGTSTAATNGFGKLQIGGFASAMSLAPTMLLYGFGDVYPFYHLVGYNHDDIDMLFDAWRIPGLISNSSSATSNFRINKNTNLITYYASGVAQGSSISWSVGTVLNPSGQFGIGRDLYTTSSHRLQVYGTDNSSSLTNNANIATYTTADTYPLLHIQSQQHNNIVLGFDTYWDGSSYRSSNSSSNFQLGKVTNQLKVLYGSGTAQGSVPSLGVASYWDTSGNFNCNNTINTSQIACSAQPCLMMSASTYISASTATDTQFSGFDTTDYTSGSIGFAAGVATVPSIGTYLVCCEMTYDANSVGTGNYDELWILKNGATIYGRHRSPNSSSNTMYLTTSATIRMAASDTIEIYVRQNSGSNLHIGTITGSTARLEITKLH